VRTAASVVMSFNTRFCNTLPRNISCENYGSDRHRPCRTTDIYPSHIPTPQTTPLLPAMHRMESHGQIYAVAFRLPDTRHSTTRKKS
jgi:hypothetical protein